MLSQVAMLLDRQNSETYSSFLDDVISGLHDDPRRLPSKYFYDDYGATLFNRICQLPEYYPTRAELDITRRFAPQMAELFGPSLMLVEFGSGSGQKTRELLSHLECPVAYVPIDISQAQLGHTGKQLAAEFPAIEVLPVCADFTRLADLPLPQRPVARIGVYFPGSTVGNFTPPEVSDLLKLIVNCCGFGGSLLIGIDLQKDIATLEAAYNDAEGVTAQFNLNLLRRINRELGADFRIEQFYHSALYNECLGRIEMNLVSECPQLVTIRDNQFQLAAGERICTEYSYKYSIAEFADAAAAEGLMLCDYWTDTGRRFAVLQFDVFG